MKVLIVNPPPYEDRRFVREGRCEQRMSSFQYVMVPISLPSMAAVLREGGHEVRIIDCIAQDVPLAGLVDEVGAFGPGLVIFNVATATFPADKEAIAAVREASRAHLTALGVHVTSEPEGALKGTALDSVIRGEPEATAAALADALAGGTPLSDVAGISFKDGSAFVHNSPRDYIEDLDSLPFPARDLIENERYVMPVSNRPYTLIITSRGCPHKCIFCTAHCYYGGKLRRRSAPNIVDEMVEVKEKYGIDDITMWSDTFTLDRALVMDVCDEIERRGLKVRWMCNARVDTVDQAMLTRMAETGCTVMSYGVESGVQDILDRVKKGTTVGQIRDAFRWTRDARIETIAHVILGLPGESPATIQETLALVQEIRPDYAQFYCAIPFPGTEFYETARNEGWLITDDPTRFEINQAIISTPELSAEELDRARTRAFRWFYLRPTYMIDRLRGARSAREVANLFREGSNFLRDWAVGS